MARVEKNTYAIDRVIIKVSSAASHRLKGLSAEDISIERFGIEELDRITSELGAVGIEYTFPSIQSSVRANEIGLKNWITVFLGENSSVNEAIEIFSRSSFIEYAVPDYYAYTFTEPNDPLYVNNWGHNNNSQLPAYENGSHSGEGVGVIGFDSDSFTAWELEPFYGNSNVVIAIIDTGVDTSHPDLRLINGYDFGEDDADPNPELDNPNNPEDNPAHGTNCAGIAAAKTNNSIGVTGVAGGCSIMPLKVANAQGIMLNSIVAEAIIYATDNFADVISMSFGSYHLPGDMPYFDDAIEYAFNNGNGIPLFAATANDEWPAIVYPANHPDVMAIGAASPSGERKSPTSSDGESWWGSNYGSDSQDDAAAVDLMGPTILPTTDIIGALGSSSEDYYLWFNGTSCATPYVAGVAALLLSYQPSLTANEIRQALTESARDMTIDGGVGWDMYTGYGLVNTKQALISIYKPINGDGSSESPFEIVSLENLYWIADDITRWNKHYIQTADIDASATQVSGWSVIGNDMFPFMGVYNGNNHVISGLHVNRPGYLEVGLFGCLEGALVRDLGLTDVLVSGYMYVGGLAGKIGFDSHLLRCYVKGDVIGNEGFIGGLVGYEKDNCTISLCFTTGSVTSTGSVMGGDTGCVGGLVGFVDNSLVTNCFSWSSVTGKYFVGGLVGMSASSMVDYCYSVGGVSGSAAIGGLIGLDFPVSTITSCYWDVYTSGQSISAGGVGRPTALMKQRTTYVGWNFSVVWKITENNYIYYSTYPYISGMDVGYYYYHDMGTWTNLNHWYVSTDCFSWIRATQLPTAFNSIGIIQESPAGTLSQDVTLDQMTVTSTLTIGSGGILRLNNGLGDDLTINGDLVIGGTLVFQSGANMVAGENSTIEFSGRILQHTGSGFPTAVNNLVINNSAGVIFTNPTTVNGILTQTIGTTSGTINIDGYDSTANYLSFPETGHIISGWSVAMTTENTNPGRIARQWTLNGTFTQSKSVTFKWTSADDHGIDWAGLGIAPSVYNGSIEYTQIAYNVTNDPRSITVNIPSFFTKGIYTIGPANDETLPVELSSFTAVLNAANIIQIQWVTQSESNLAGYHILRNTKDELETATMINILIEATNTSQMQVYVYHDLEITNEGEYYYWLQSLDIDGGCANHGPISIVLTNPSTSLTPIQLHTGLHSVYPNPFNSKTSLNFTLAHDEHVLICIYNQRGQLVRELKNEYKQKGIYHICWDGKDDYQKELSSGVYFFRMRIGGCDYLRKGVLMK